MVVPRAVLQGRPPGSAGLAAGDRASLAAALQEYLFLPRRRAEGDRRYRQVIPYVVVQVSGAGPVYRYLMFQRTRGGDPRLGRYYSIGLGGHVNTGDVLVPPVAWAVPPKRGAVAYRRRRLVRRVSLGPELRELLGRSLGVRAYDHPLFRGMRRELREEMVFPAGAAVRYLGAISEDRTAVDQVHLGLAFLLTVGGRPSPAPAGPGGRPGVRLRREPGSLQAGGLFTLEEIQAYRHAMEGWSVRILESGLLPGSRSGGVEGER